MLRSISYVIVPWPVNLPSPVFNHVNTIYLVLSVEPRHCAIQRFNLLPLDLHVPTGHLLHRHSVTAIFYDCHEISAPLLASACDKKMFHISITTSLCAGEEWLTALWHTKNEHFHGLTIGCSTSPTPQQRLIQSTTISTRETQCTHTPPNNYPNQPRTSVLSHAPSPAILRQDLLQALLSGVLII